MLSARTRILPRLRAHATQATELLAAFAILALLNLIAWKGISSLGLIPKHRWNLTQPLAANLYLLQLMLAAAGVNLAVAIVMLGVRRRVLQPWQHIRSIVRHTSLNLSEERDMQAISARSVREMALSIARFATHAQNTYAQCRALRHELEESRQMMEQIASQHRIAMTSTNRELNEQYRSVLAYANYLEDHIRSQKSDAQLRYDFDDVCESGFNLKLIARSLELLHHHTPEAGAVTLSSLLQQTVIALAPSLERRVMKLSTAGVDEAVVAASDLHLLGHALWMMLLGTIRYAAEESTLRLRCFQASNGDAIISIGISELEPGQLSPEERHAHMMRQLQHMTPPMFAETIRLHANAQLASLMLDRAGGTLSVLPISTHACEISMVLPAVKK